MTKKVLWASVRVPEDPRVRFFVKDTSSPAHFREVTQRVAKLVIEDVEDGTGYCVLLRLDADGALVWKTRHPSLQETKWHVEFEYGLPEERWAKFESEQTSDPAQGS
jgi:hypothetical protein